MIMTRPSWLVRVSLDTKEMIEFATWDKEDYFTIVSALEAYQKNCPQRKQYVQFDDQDGNAVRVDFESVQWVSIQLQ